MHPLTLLMIWLLFSACQPRSNDPVTARPMQVLFLGHDSKHHDSRMAAPLLTSSLSRQGFQFTYSEDLQDLNEDYLNYFDALLIYANYDEISTQQESALLSFVEHGGAFLPIHCASYCFRKSDKVVNLIGGQFSSHDTATFRAEIIEQGHPALQDFETFETWDETYVHTKLASDIHVLMERVEGNHREPYTWIKEYGQGRVFYTALGHDERTWSQPQFIQLVASGLRWAIGQEKEEALDSLELPDLSYAPAKIPNYEERDPPPQLQAPLNPEQSQKYIQVPPGFSLRLFASEPEIFNPIHMDWDEKGRLWIIETKDYPNEIKTALGEGSDRIKILEDTDQDGRADRFTIFAENLSVPTSMTFARGGVIVSQAPYFLFLKDTTGDDKADVMEVIMKGWGTSDTHAGPSNLQYGYDNQIWGVLGYSGFEGTVGQTTHKFRQGAYHFLPDGSELEYMGSTSNNTWGLAFSEDFDVFISTANNTHSAFLGIPHRLFDGVQGLKIQSVKKIDGHYAFHPNTKNVRQVDVFGGFTAAAGHSFYTARDFPKDYWNRIALVCEPTGHLLHRAIIERQGAGYREVDGWNLLASVDEWVSPIQAEVGPDGAVWILDWYNFIIQHNPTPPGFENGPGNAHINPLRDKEHGRIYRLVFDDADHQWQPALDYRDKEQLVQALNGKNMRWRMHAQRLLVERGLPDVASDLASLIQNKSIDEVGLNLGAIHALWTLHGLHLINEKNPDVLKVVFEALNHPSGAVRKNTIRVLPRDVQTFVKLQEANILEDSDPTVVLAAILSLAEMPEIPAIGERLYALSKTKRVIEDEWLSRAIYVAAVRHKETFIAAMHRTDRSSIAEGYQQDDETIDWSSPDLSVEDWSEITTPTRWSKSQAEALHSFDGVMWTRTTFSVPVQMVGKPSTLHLGPIDDSDVTYINGIQVGRSNRKWNDFRKYTIPKDVLHAGQNVLAIKITDGGGRGGIYGDPEDVFIRSGTEVVNLSGTWLYKIERQFFPNRSIFQEGISIKDLFLKHYGPYAKQLSEELARREEEATRTLVVKTVPDQMRYDPEQLSVIAGETVKIVFENNDGMQHNLLIGSPGSLELIGQAADNLAQNALGASLEYIPPLPQILLSAGLVDPGENRTLIWDVPPEAGDYPFVCTFPGHWRTMNGVITVKSPNL